MSKQNDSERWQILLIENNSQNSPSIIDIRDPEKAPFFNIISAEDFTSALNIFDPGIHDIVLVDHFIREKQMLRGLRDLRSIEVHTPFILLSDDDTGMDFEEVCKLGVQGYLTLKNSDSGVLVSTLRIAAFNAKMDRKKSFQENRYRIFIDNMDDAYYECNLKGEYTYVNGAAAKHFGRSQKELTGMSYKKLTSKSVQAKLRKEFNRVYKTGKSCIITGNEVVRPDGTILFTETSVNLLRDENGNAVGFAGVSRDVTEKKETQKALTKSEERYRNILTSIEDGYFETDLRGRLTFFNDTLVKIFGYDREEMMSMSARSYMVKKDAELISEAYKRIYKTGIPEGSLQYRIKRKDGGIRYIETSVSLKENMDGEAVGYRGIGRDITGRKQFEIELKTAKEEAEQANRAKSEFLANMSHEIRTPMNGIIGMYNLLLSTDLTPEQMDFVETGKRSADALLGVINDILDFSKIEAGKLDIDIIDFDFRKTIEEIVSLPAIQAQNKGLEFVYEIANDVPTLLKGDPGRLRQILMNLCTNAIKFTPQGEILLKIKARKETKKKLMLNFSVKDTGIGISRGDQDLLFHSFQQVDASTTRKYGGTGLGLAISKKLVDLMGGSIRVESRPEKGSTFIFSIPFEKQESDIKKRFNRAGSIRDKRILIVDDNQTNLDILSGYLEYWGCACDQALSGKMALSLMRAVAKAGAPYDVVISDLVMPEMDGAELGRKIKADQALKDTRLVMLTSQGLRGDAAMMKEIGFGGYLNKPVRRSLLYDCLVTVVSRIPDSEVDGTEDKLVTTYTVAEEKRHNLKILLAEDNPVNRKLAIHLLINFGFNVDSAQTGREAVEALANKEYHVVLMDIQMPEMDGLEATKYIRNPESEVLNHDVLVIAMTAHAMKGDRKMCLDAGMDDYISKPINPETLLKVIEKNIKNFE